MDDDELEEMIAKLQGIRTDFGHLMGKYCVLTVNGPEKLYEYAPKNFKALDDPIEIMPFSKNSPFPRNSEYLDSRQTIVVYNRFSRGKFDEKQVQNFSWVGTSERKSSLSDDEESLKGGEVKCEAKEMV